MLTMIFNPLIEDVGEVKLTLLLSVVIEVQARAINTLQALYSLI
jgi:hypothetical protein